MGLVGVVAVAATLLTLALTAVQMSLQSYVEVFLPSEATLDDPESGGVLASLGVFQTTYNSANIDADIVAASGIPVGEFSTRTTEFPLLFPAQQNFIVDILPLNAELVGQLDTVVGGAASQALNPFLEPLNERVFDNCSNYMTNTKTDLDNLFNTLVGGLLPALVSLNFATPVADLNLQLANIAGLFSGAENPVIGILVGTFAQVSAGFDATKVALDGFLECSEAFNNDLSIATPINSVDLSCLSSAYDGAADALPAGSESQILLQDISVHVNSCAELGVDLSALECLGRVGTQVQRTPLGGPISFVPAVDGGQTFCDIWRQCEEDTTILEFMAALGALAVENPSPDSQLLVTATGAVVGLTFGGVVPPDAIFGAPIVFDPTFPGSFTDPYVACSLLAFSAGVPVEGGCGFSGFFQTLAAVPDVGALAPVLLAVDGLFSQCELFGFAPPACGEVFSALFIHGAYGRGLDISLLGLEQSSVGVFADAVEACLDDEEDISVFTNAQATLIVSMIFYVLVVLCGFVAVCNTGNARFLHAFTGVLAILAAGLNLGALLLTSSAPVFELVGGEPAALAPLYVTGSVPVIGLATIVIQFLAALLHFFASRVAPQYQEPKKEEAEMVPEKLDDVETAVKVEEPVVKAEEKPSV